MSVATWWRNRRTLAREVNHALATVEPDSQWDKLDAIRALRDASAEAAADYDCSRAVDMRIRSEGRAEAFQEVIILLGGEADDEDDDV